MLGQLLDVPRHIVGEIADSTTGEVMEQRIGHYPLVIESRTQQRERIPALLLRDISLYLTHASGATPDLPWIDGDIGVASCLAALEQNR